jgi:hypothetical protein
VVNFAVEKEAPRQASLRVIHFSPLNIIPPVLHIHLRSIYTMFFPEGQMGKAWEFFKATIF